MISVTITSRDGAYSAINCLGHAGFADAGDDIVCAAASILVINTINAIDILTSSVVSVDQDKDSGRIDARLSDMSGEAAILVDAMAMGLKEIERQYGRRYITLVMKED